MFVCSRKSKESPNTPHGKQQHLLMAAWASGSNGRGQDYLSVLYTSAVHILGSHTLSARLRLSVTGHLVSAGRTGAPE